MSPSKLILLSTAHVRKDIMDIEGGILLMQQQLSSSLNETRRDTMPPSERLRTGLQRRASSESSDVASSTTSTKILENESLSTATTLLGGSRAAQPRLPTTILTKIDDMLTDYLDTLATQDNYDEEALAAMREILREGCRAAALAIHLAINYEPGRQQHQTLNRLNAAVALGCRLAAVSLIRTAKITLENRQNVDDAVAVAKDVAKMLSLVGRPSSRCRCAGWVLRGQEVADRIEATVHSVAVAIEGGSMIEGRLDLDDILVVTLAELSEEDGLSRG
jgi:hypothetical protein